MKTILILCLGASLTACAYAYRIDVDENAPVEKYSRIQFSNTIKVSEIDGKPFERKFSIWVHGSHEVVLPAGYHTFKFRYNAVSGNGGYYTNSDTLLAAHLEAGKLYEISYKLEAGRIYFKIQKIEEASQEPQKETTRDGNT